MPADYYEVLGVERNATDVEIKKAYRAKAMQYHPDRNPNDSAAEAKFRECTAAYQVLSDPEKKQQYDQYGRTFDDVSSAGSGYGSATSFFDDLFGDVFGDIFGGRSTRSSATVPRKGSNIEASRRISFEESVFGTEVEIKAKQKQTCSHCSGSGAAPNGTERCPTCDGSGMRAMRQGFFAVQTTCPSCGGLGKIVKEKCSECSGSGYYYRDKLLNIKVPAGIEDGMAIRAAREGNAGLNGGSPGDLILSIYVEPHKYYRRQDNDLILEMPITFVDAVLGKEISVPMLDKSEETVVVKPGVQFGDTINLRGKGVPDVRGRGKGDLIIDLKILLPTNLNEKQREIFMQFDKSADERTYKGNKSLWKRMKKLFKQ